MQTTEDLEHLHHEGIVAAPLGIPDGALRLCRNASVICARQKYRDANAQRECRVRPVSALLQWLERTIDDLGRRRVAPLEIRELGPPCLDPKRQADVGP